MKEARTAHRKKKETAGDWGKDTHSFIEQAIKKCIPLWEGKMMYEDFEDANSDEFHTQGVDNNIQIAVSNFFGWARESEVKFLESEKHVWSKELWIGGVLDMVFEMGGKKLIGDVKTSSAIYNEHFFQMAAYELCLEEMGVKDIDGYLVINLKKDGSMDLKIAENREINKEAFRHALGLYKITQNLK